MFSRVRCMMRGSIVDDISSYNRTHETMSISTSKANRDNDDVNGFGRRWDDSVYYSPNLADRTTGIFRGSNSGEFDLCELHQMNQKVYHSNRCVGCYHKGNIYP